MFITKKHLSRRTVLKGAGAAIALPLLDAMSPAGVAWGQTAAGKIPHRLAFVGFPHGAVMRHWKPEQTGRDYTLRVRNAQGDMPTGIAIARQVTAGNYDLVITSSTPSMQAVANTNRDGKVRHVFTLVADPFASGVGLDRADADTKGDLFEHVLKQIKQHPPPKPKKPNYPNRAGERIRGREGQGQM